jgi:protein-export membrane protein SecD
LVYEADTSKIPAEDRADALDGVRDVIERRVNAFGVAEPIIQTNKSGDTWRVIVELAGVKDVSQAIKMIGETPILEFREENPNKNAVQELTKEQKAEMAKYNAEALTRAWKAIADLNKGADFAELAKKISDDAGSAELGGDLGWFATGTMVKPFEDAALKLSVGKMTKSPVKSDFGYHIIKKVEEKMVDKDGKQVLEMRASHILIKTMSEKDFFPPPEEWAVTGLSGKQLKNSSVQFDLNTGEPTVALSFNDEGKTLFAAITERNVGKPVAIFLDGQPISIPRVNEPIRDGNAIISGNFGVAEAKQLSQRLNAGALPVPINLVGQQTIGASLGAASVEKSLFAGLVGFILVAIFMILFYRLPGFLAVLALSLYTVIVLALFKLIPVTMTLAGIAGFILTLGMAVDANILIFSRTKEEVLWGKPLPTAIEEGFRRAWPSIRDSNVTSLISAMILFWFSSSIIKGFALTLSIGVLVSMFSAITVSRILIRLVAPLVKNPWWFGVNKK